MCARRPTLARWVPVPPKPDPSERCADVVLLGVPDMGSTTRFAQPLRFIAGVRGGTIDAVTADLAARPGRTYVDIAGETGPAFRDDPGRLFAADDYHPSDAGYTLWADAVVAAAATAPEAGR